MSSRSKFGRRLKLVGVLCLAGAAALVAQMYSITVIEGKELSEQARSITCKDSVETAYRGQIVDRNGAALATSMQSFQIAMRRGEYVYATLHRPSNVDDTSRLSELVRLLRSIGEHAPVVLPMHPRTTARLTTSGGHEKLGPRVHVLPPVPYRDAVSFLDGAAVAITDSGGIQEEASQLGVRCITLRTTTERPATVTLGTNVVCGGDLVTAEHLAIRSRGSIGEIHLVMIAVQQLERQPHRWRHEEQFTVVRWFSVFGENHGVDAKREGVER